MTAEQLQAEGLALLSPTDEEHGWELSEAEVLCEVRQGRHATLYIICTVIERDGQRRWRVLFVRRRHHAGASFHLIAIHHPQSVRAVVNAMERALEHPEVSP